MFLLDDQIVYSASDLSAAASCEFALLRQLDARTGLIAAEAAEADPMLERTSSLGDSHEREQLQKFIDQHGDGVVVMPRPEHSRAGLTAATLATVEAARSGAPVIYQGTFFDGRFLGFCDFLVREGDTYASTTASSPGTPRCRHFYNSPHTRMRWSAMQLPHPIKFIYC